MADPEAPTFPDDSAQALTDIQREELYRSRLYREGADYRRDDGRPHPSRWNWRHNNWEPVVPAKGKPGVYQQNASYRAFQYKRRRLPTERIGGPWRDEFLTRGRQLTIRRQERLWRLPGPRAPGARPRGPTLTPAQQELASLPVRSFAIDTRRISMRFCRTLGWGGNGLASLWQWNGFDGLQPTQWLVLKSSTQLDENENELYTEGIKDEKAWYHLLSRSPHIVQLFRLLDQPAPPGGVPRRSRNIASNVDGSDEVYLMEHAAMGTLRDVCQKAVVSGPGFGLNPLFFPRGVLWSFFECLVKGCYAMMYPPIHQPGNANALVPGGAPLPGTPPRVDRKFLLSSGLLPDIPPGAVNNRRSRPEGNIVHFDLDPSNVFVAGLNAANGNLDGHTQVPRLLVADFGLAETQRNLTQDHELFLLQDDLKKAEEILSTVWLMKQSGKGGWLLPEQFDSSWEQYPALTTPYSFGNLDANAIAGNYSERSNIFQIGLCMYTCMELGERGPPPYAVRKPEFETHGLADPPQDRQCWTYGDSLWSVPNQRRYGKVLCDTVAKCLLRTPAQRPSLDELMAIITPQIALPKNAIPPAFDGSLPGGFFAAPPPPPASIFNAVGAVDFDAVYGIVESSDEDEPSSGEE